MPAMLSLYTSAEKGGAARGAGSGSYGGLVGVASRRYGCSQCGQPLEEYSEEVIVMCIVITEAYLNHDLNLAASMVYDMIHSISDLATLQIYCWQNAE